MTPRRPKLIVAATFPVHPPLGGGQVRAANLYAGLSERFDIELVTLVASESLAGTRRYGEHLVEHAVAKTARHAQREFEIELRAGVPVTDIAMAEMWEMAPDYVETLRTATASADAVVACHPYTFPVIREVTDLPLIYEAQDVEVVLKQRVLGESEEAQRLIGVVESVERACCDDAVEIWTCSAEDKAELLARYGGDAGRIRVVPNGVALDEVPFVSPTERADRRSRLRLDQRTMAVFLASWHGPNILAARELLALAPRVPDVEFAIVGSVCEALRGQPTPDNVQLLGVVSLEMKQAITGVAEVALNPVSTGSGTNLKMVEYLASGMPVISTAFGARGLSITAGEHYLPATTGNFDVALERFRQLGPAGCEPMAAVARRHVETNLSWPAITADLAPAVSLLTAADIGAVSRP